MYATDLRPFSSRAGVRGFTLIEVLVVIAIVAILFALISAVLIRAKSQAGSAVEISNLRQLGQAAQMYAEDYGEFPLGTEAIVASKLAPASICRIPSDFTERGVANRVIEEEARMNASYSGMQTDYFNSFLGFRDLLLPRAKFDKYVRDDPGGGWLVSLVHSEPAVPDRFMPPFKGRYRRLMLDGSVQWRTHVLVHIDDGSSGGAIFGHPIFMFMDEVERWKQDLFGRG